MIFIRMSALLVPTAVNLNYFFHLTFNSLVYVNKIRYSLLFK